MPLRMTGLISGLDTDAVVKELMSAHTLKKTKIEQKKTKAEWKQEKWAELNKKIYALYTEQVSKLKLQGTYMSKKVTSSNESMVTATANSSAATGSHIISVNQLASSQYVTGASIEATNKTTLTSLGMTQGSIINIKSKVGQSDEKSMDLIVGADTTISDFVAKLQEAGLNANFDEQQGRFFISSKESGLENSFTITSNVVATSAIDDNNTGDGTTDDTLIGWQNKLVELGASSSNLNLYYSAIKEQEKKKTAWESATEENEKLEAYEEYDAARKAALSLKDTIVKQIEDKAIANATKEEKDNYKQSLIDVANKDENDMSEEEKELYDIYVEAENSVKEKYYTKTDDGEFTESASFTEEITNKAKTAIEEEIAAEKQKLLALGKDETTAEAEATATVYGKYTTDTTNIDAAITGKATEMYETALSNALETKASQYVAKEEVKAEIKEKLDSDANGTIDLFDANGDATTAITNYTDKIIENIGNEGSNPPDSSKFGASELGNLGLININSQLEVSEDATFITKDGKFVDANGYIKNEDGTTTTTKVDLKDCISIVSASDAEITLDGATLTGSSNNFTAAGLTFDLKGKTSTPVTMNVSNDVDEVYNTIKDFFKEYNNILKEMNTLYGASSAKGYEPLTDEEKEAMTEEQIELWENKIKDSLLRRDTTLGSLANSMKSVMQSTVNVDGKSYSLSSFGIMTSTDYTEGGLLHIYGDKDDAVYSNSTDKLKKALTEDADTVAEVISGIVTNLSNTLMDKMKKTSLSSALTFYNDTQMKNQINDYEDEIDKWEDRLKEIENRYYSQFTAMEKAMATLQSQSSYLANLMGTA